MCSDAHFKAIVIGMSRINLRLDGPPRGVQTLAEMTETARLLKAVNIRSSEARYLGDPGTSDPDIKVTKSDVLKEPRRSLGQILQYIHCLDYQSCESEGWETSKAYRVLMYFVDIIAREATGAEYEKAEWAIH
jgi:hypothetical protein